MTIRVLVVEDEALIAEDLQRTLQKLGYDVPEPVATGAAAVAAARELRPDLVLMDVRLGTRPDAMDGIEAAREIHRRLDVPVVFLTAHADEATIGRAKLARPYGYLLKPFEDRELRTTIELALHKHQLDAQLNEQRRWFSTILESLADAVVATDAEGNVTFLNSAAERLTHWKRDDAIGQPIEAVLPISASSAPGLESPVRAAMRSASPVGIPESSTLRAKDGGVLAIDDTAAPILDDAGNLLGGVVVFRDVTEKRKLEQRLALSERLAAIGTLSAGIAHEINNPLTYVVGNVALAREGVQSSLTDLGTLRLSGEARGLVDDVRTRLDDLQVLLGDAGEGAERVRQIVADLKRFARPDERALHPLELPRLIDAAVKMTAHVLRHHARLRIEYGATPPVLGVEGSLVQVFTNLLVNAAQAIPSGDADHHEIAIRTFADEDGRAVVEIRDSGRGISQEALARIFDPFFTTKPGGSGMGLGLAICRSIVGSLGGEISVESQPGRGTTFCVALPTAPAITEPSPPRAQEAPQRRGRILVVDDEATVAGTIHNMLRRDHDVTVTTQGSDALTRLDRGETYDLVLCDLMMPTLSGMELYDTISARHPEHARRIVFMTGGSFTENAREFLARVPNRVLSKPFALQELRAVVRDLVGSPSPTG